MAEVVNQEEDDVGRCGLAARGGKHEGGKQHCGKAASNEVVMHRPWQRGPVAQSCGKAEPGLVCQGGI
jgi:hypothetical protein